MKYLQKTVFTIALTFIFSLAANAGDKLLSQGTLNGAFSSWGKSSLQGDWKIVEENGNSYIELGDNFKAKDGPDVKIFLSPISAEDVTGDNATQGSLFVVQISSFEGENRIKIPAGTNIQDYKTLIFHCEAYSKLWGTSELHSTS